MEYLGTSFDMTLSSENITEQVKIAMACVFADWQPCWTVRPWHASYGHSDAQNFVTKGTWALLYLIRKILLILQDRKAIRYFLSDEFIQVLEDQDKDFPFMFAVRCHCGQVDDETKMHNCRVCNYKSRAKIVFFYALNPQRMGMKDLDDDIKSQIRQSKLALVAFADILYLADINENGLFMRTPLHCHFEECKLIDNEIWKFRDRHLLGPVQIFSADDIKVLKDSSWPQGVYTLDGYYCGRQGVRFVEFLNDDSLPDPRNRGRWTPTTRF
jgi:hypothetical protein